MKNNYDLFDEEFLASLTPEERELGQAFEDHFALAQEIRALRRALGLTQTQLAENSGVPQPEISRIEHGETGFTVARAQKLARAMGAHIAVVLRI